MKSILGLWLDRHAWDSTASSVLEEVSYFLQNVSRNPIYLICQSSRVTPSTLDQEHWVEILFSNRLTRTDFSLLKLIAVDSQIQKGLK